jgi:hypothetical protein
MFLGIPPKPSQPSLRSLANKFSCPHSTPYSQFTDMTKNLTFRTAGGRIVCIQCQATAKSTRRQCQRPATKGKPVCKLHGGKSTGPKTAQGRQRCAEARLVQGQDTTSIRKERRLASARLAVLEMAGHILGIMHGPRTRGRQPGQMPEAYPELQEAVTQFLLRKVVSRA